MGFAGYFDTCPPFFCEAPSCDAIRGTCSFQSLVVAPHRADVGLAFCLLHSVYFLHGLFPLPSATTNVAPLSPPRRVHHWLMGSFGIDIVIVFVIGIVGLPHPAPIIQNAHHALQEAHLDRLAGGFVDLCTLACSTSA